MFYLLLICALIGYALQASLLVQYARKLDGFQVSMYRGLSLIIIMLPLLFWSPLEDFERLFVPQNIGLLVAAGFTGYLGNAMSMHASKYLHIGLLETLNASGKGILYVAVGYLVYQEIISPIQFGLITTIIVGAILLTTKKTEGSSITPNTPKGLAFLAGSITCSVTTVSIMGGLSQSINPFIVGYFWEVFIAGAGIISIVTYTKTHNKPFPSITWKQFWRIFGASSPTFLGTGCLAYALTIGPLSIGGSIMTGGVFVSTILARILYKEKISAQQWLYICIIIGAIALLKLVS